MPLQRENRRRQITLNVTPYVYDVDAIALSLINQFKTYGADPEVTQLDDHKLSLTFRESDELTYEAACQKILWNQYVQNIEQKNVITNIELLKRMIDPYFDSPVVAGVNEVIGDGKGQLDGISPSAFSDGEVLWADGKPIKQPSYSIGDEEVRVPAGGPLPLSRDLDKDAQSSTIISYKKRYSGIFDNIVGQVYNQQGLNLRDYIEARRHGLSELEISSSKDLKSDIQQRHKDLMDAHKNGLDLDGYGK